MSGRGAVTHWVMRKTPPCGVSGKKSGVEDAESADGLDVMMLAAEQMNVSLTSVWHAVRGWHKTRQPSPARTPVRKTA
jgi:hypothetical protein